MSEIEEVKSQRDDLLVAAKAALQRFYVDGWPLNPENVKTCAILEHAITKAEPTKAP
jgi:hypothetical protein